MSEATNPAGNAPAVATLGAVLRTVGAPTLRPWHVPPDAADAALSDVVIHDRQSPDDAESGSVLLAVGLDVPETVRLIRAAAGAGAAAVVVRGELGSREPLTDAARQHGVALLATAPGVSWTRTASLLRNALVTTGAHPREEGADLAQHDLTAVANSLASAVHGSVVIFNPQQEILAASRLGPGDDEMRRRAVTDQHGPAAYREHLRELGVYKRLWSSDEVVSVPAVPDFGAGRRKAIMVRAGDEILGSIWVAEGEAALTADIDTVLRGAAAAASGHLVWLQARAQSQRRFGEGVLLQLLSADADVDAAAGWLGVQADQPCGVLVAWTPDPLNLRRLSSLLTMHLSAYRHRTMSLVARNSVDVVFCELGSAGLPSAMMRDLVTRAAHSLGEQVLAAVGTTQESLDGLPRSHRDADAALRVLRRTTADGATRVVDFDDVRPAIQIDRLCHHLAQHEDLLEGHARTLLEWDSRHHASLGESVLAYLDAFGNVAEGAQRINVHPNTLRYRVRKACDVSGLDLSDPEQRLMLHLQLTALTRPGLSSAT